MAENPRRLVGPVALTTSNALLYTAYQTTIVRSIHVSSTTSTAVFSLAVNGASTTLANCMYYRQYLAQNSVFQWTGFLVLATNNSLQGSLIGAGQAVITICGIEVTA